MRRRLIFCKHVEYNFRQAFKQILYKIWIMEVIPLSAVSSMGYGVCVYQIFRKKYSFSAHNIMPNFFAKHKRWCYTE